MLDGTRYVECACDSEEHTLRFVLDFDDREEHPYPVIYTSVYLNSYLPWYKRVWLAIKYIFGYHCKYGHWDCTIIDEKNINQLQSIIDEFHTGLFNRKLERLIEKSDGRT